MKVKTIDLQAKEWFDSVNGNSYFAALVTVNFGMKTEKRFTIPFTYGYEEHYKEVAKNKLKKEGVINPDDFTALWRYCDNNNIKLNYSKQEGCRRRELNNPENF
jgi:hypothetical protein